jgi:hypothetical protein
MTPPKVLFGPEVVTPFRVDEGDLAWARAGLFVYHHDGRRLNEAEPYGRMLVPLNPLHVSDLGRTIAVRLENKQRLPISFAEARYVQPAEHIPCGTWSPGLYLASDGFTVRPLPGSSEQYEERAYQQEDDELFVPLVFDPPLPNIE